MTTAKKGAGRPHRKRAAGPLVSVAGRAIDRRRLIAPGERLLLAVSGGPDSAALVLAFKALSRERTRRYRLHLAHFNHRPRGPEADADEAFVRRLASDLGIPVTVGVWNCGATRRAGGIEAAARRARYRFLAETARAVGAAAVATGHTCDDQVETILFRLLRGAPLADLGGMPWSRPIEAGSAVRLIRPFLDVSREAVLRFLTRAGVPWREDATNRDRRFTRNRIRLELLPLLERLNPGIRRVLLRMGREAGREHDRAARLARRAVSGAVAMADGRQVALPADALRGLAPTVREETLRQLTGRLVPETALSRSAVERVADLVTVGRTGATAPLGGGLRARLDYGRLVIEAAPASPPVSSGAAEVSVARSGRTVVPQLGMALDVRRRPAKPNERLPDGRRSALIDASQVRGPLALRTRRPGDRFRPLGAPGVRKLQDFFVDRKVPRAERDQIPLLCDRAGIVWVIGHTIAERVKVTPATQRNLRLVAQPAEEPSE